MKKFFKIILFSILLSQSAFSFDSSDNFSFTHSGSTYDISFYPANNGNQYGATFDVKKDGSFYKGASGTRFHTDNSNHIIALPTLNGYNFLGCYGVQQYYYNSTIWNGGSTWGSCPDKYIIKDGIFYAITTDHYISFTYDFSTFTTTYIGGSGAGAGNEVINYGLVTDYSELQSIPNEIFFPENNISCDTYNITKSVYSNYTESMAVEGYDAADDFYYISNGSGSSIIGLGEVENVNNFLTGALNINEEISFFGKNNIFGIGDKPFIYLYDERGIEKIRITGDNISISNIKLFDMQGNFSRNDNGDNVSNGKYLYGSYLSARIELSKSLSEMNIEYIEFGGENIIEEEEEYCINTQTGEQTLGGDVFTGDPNSLNTSTGSIDDIQFSFTSSGYEFLENGFILHNFIPSPSGGNLIFEILNPLGERIFTNGTKNYGFDVATKITYPYHEEVGDYKVRIIYEYLGNKIFISGEEFNNYTITIAERGLSEEELNELYNNWDTQKCNDGREEQGFLPGVSNFFICATDTMSGVMQGISNFFSSIKEFFDSFSNIVTDEVKEFSLIPNTNAEYIGEMFNGPNEGYKDTSIGKIESVLKRIPGIAILVLGIVFFIFINSRKSD